MQELTVRDLDDDLVTRLKRRAAANRRSVEEEHRHLLRAALPPDGFAELLLAIPAVGDDSDFARFSDVPR